MSSLNFFYFLVSVETRAPAVATTTEGSTGSHSSNGFTTGR